MSTQTSEALEVGKQLVELCKQGKNLEAVDTLYGDGVVSVELFEFPPLPRVAEGIEAVRQKNKWWLENHEVHSGEAIGPFPHDDRFIVYFKYDTTSKVGPMAGQRMQMEEAGLYTVADGKIVKEEFFYAPMDC